MKPAMTSRPACIAMTVVLLASGMAATSRARASDVSPVGSDVEASLERDRATVSVDGRPLFQVRGVSARPAAVRARFISEKIKALAADRGVSSESLRVEEALDHSEVRAGDVVVVSVYDSDAALEGVRRQPLAEAIRRRIGEAMTSYRHERDPRVLLVNGAYALGATLLVVLLLLALSRVLRRLDAMIEHRFRSRIERLQAQSFEIIQAGRVHAAVLRLLGALRVVSMSVLAYLYLDFVLGLFPWTRPLAQWLLALLLDPVRVLGAAAVATLPKLVFLAVLAVVTRWVLRAAHLFFEGIARGTITLSGFERDWALPTFRLARLLIIGFALVVAYPYIPGSGSEAFKGISIFLGVVFSLGSSSFIANMLAGYSMIYRRAFQVGDRIQIGEIIGDVVEARLMVTRLRTVKNEEVVVPNSLILSGHVVNYSTLARQQGLILHTTVGIGYETPWRQVEAMLKIAAERTPGLLKEPPPFVLQKALADFAVTYEINAYCDDPQAMSRLYTALHQHILDVFNEYGVQIMTPAYERDPEQPKVVPKDQWFAAPHGMKRAEDPPDRTGDE